VALRGDPSRRMTTIQMKLGVATEGHPYKRLRADRSLEENCCARGDCDERT
jgi:hypothetical protein